MPVNMSHIAIARSASAGPSPAQKRRLMLASSGLGGSSALIAPPSTNGSSAIPQIGQGTGCSSFTSGSIGQTHQTFAPAGTAGGASGAAAPPVFAARYFSGSALNFARHFGLQKK